jgi:hypothetical protein
MAKERAKRYAEQLRGARAVASGLSERREEHGFLSVGERLAGHGAAQDGGF